MLLYWTSATPKPPLSRTRAKEHDSGNVSYELGAEPVANAPRVREGADWTERKSRYEGFYHWQAETVQWQIRPIADVRKARKHTRDIFRLSGRMSKHASRVTEDRKKRTYDIESLLTQRHFMGPKCRHFLSKHTCLKNNEIQLIWRCPTTYAHKSF